MYVHIYKITVLPMHIWLFYKKRERKEKHLEFRNSAIASIKFH